MEKRIKERYSPEIFEEVLQRYGIPQENVTNLDGFENFMYEFSNSQGDYILRVSHSFRRTPEMIRGEVDWINYLVRNDVGAAEAVESLSGELVEEVDDGQGGVFLATKFVRAPGGRPDWGGWGPDFIRDYGWLMGRMHRVTKNYQVPDPAWRRAEWDDPINMDLENWLPESEHWVLEGYTDLRNYLNSLPKNKDTYALIHQDAHAGNFFVDADGKITLFDFDDCCYGWFAYDVAMVLFYALESRNSPGEYVSTFMPPFLEGYRKEYPIDAFWIKQIPYFLKLREIDLYGVIHRSFDVENLDDPWVSNFMNGRKERIEKNIPYVDFDFSALK